MKKPATKIGVYVRVSTRDKQTTKSQRHAIREWARAERIQPDSLKWYEDKLSGAKAERPALNKMLFTASQRDQPFDLLRVKAAGKHAVGARMERGGMRWSRRGAQATLSLRTTSLNEEWNDLWALRLQAV